ncbi:MAG TPA: sigma-70 family RNA polymerase sigma factor [Candidatus Blautia excrementipullorum]|nr:sigma-70 family RNA polymerase sigma factor [Candidatus Blautia excrementipullorum]
MNGYDQCSDEELIARLQNGEKEISDYLMEKYKEFVRKKARAVYLIGGETDDLIQEGMIGLFKAVQDYRPEKEASFRTFAGLCIDRQLYNAIQSSNRQKHLPLNSYVSLSEAGETEDLEGRWSENPEAVVIDQERTRALAQKIRKTLSPMENKVLKYYMQGYGYVKIAELLGKKPKSIDNALQRIRGKIRSCTEKIQR